MFDDISVELQAVLDSLANGEYVPSERIANTPEYRYAATRCPDNKTQTSYINTEYRIKLRESVYKNALKIKSVRFDNDGNVVYNGSVRKGNRLDIVIGLPASGKSSALVDVISNEFRSRVIDNDMFKKMFPEYDDGFGANIVHKESQQIEERVFLNSLKSGENIVYPKVGGDPDKMKRIISAAKEYGYSAHLHYVELNRNIALGRMIKRFLDTMRYLPYDLIDKYDNPEQGNLIKRTYETIKKEGILDGYSRWSNEVKRGERPRIIEAKCIGARPNFIEEGLMERFVYIRDIGSERETNGKMGVRGQNRHMENGGQGTGGLRAESRSSRNNSVLRGSFSSGRTDSLIGKLSSCAAQSVAANEKNSAVKKREDKTL